MTAAFNTNLLTRINRELDGDFRIDRFAHEARWNSMNSAVEMHLVSLEAQTAVVDGQSFDFERRRVNSYGNLPQVRCARLFRLVESAGWYIEEMWTDARQSFGVFGLASCLSGHAESPRAWHGAGPGFGAVLKSSAPAVQ